MSFLNQLQATLSQRQNDYASPSDNHQLTADLVSNWLSVRLGFPIRLTAEDMCAINVLQKMSRLTHKTKDDSWLDVMGYAENVSQLDPVQRNDVPAYPAQERPDNPLTDSASPVEMNV